MAHSQILAQLKFENETALPYAGTFMESKKELGVNNAQQNLTNFSDLGLNSETDSQAHILRATDEKIPESQVIHHWSEIQGNPFLQRLDSRMLREQGVGFRRDAKLRRPGYSYKHKQRLTICYDRSFIIAKLHNTISPLIGELGLKEIVALVKEAYNYKPSAKNGVDLSDAR